MKPLSKNEKFLMPITPKLQIMQKKGGMGIGLFCLCLFSLYFPSPSNADTSSISLAPSSVSNSNSSPQSTTNSTINDVINNKKKDDEVNQQVSSGAAKYTDADFEIWKKSFKQEVLERGIKASVFEKALGSVKFDPNVIKLDSDQPEFTRNIWDYIDNATSKKRIKKGRALLRKYKKLFDKIEEEYGVQREIILAIWAMESDFGRNYGKNNILRSLATLAYHGKRADFAKEELLAALSMIQKRKLSPKKLIGSWAGAMGQPQFMPSSYLRYAVDYNNDNKVDLWKSLPDILASIANFLAESGWRRGEDWGVEVKLPRDFDWRLNSSAYELRYFQWKMRGVEQANGKPYKHLQRLATLFIPAGRFGPVFLVTHNFNILKSYNKSTSYVLAIALLSELFAGGESNQIAWPRDDKALSHDQITELQLRLTIAGHDPGKADGKIGSKTREAIRTWQLEQDLPGDGYANNDLLQLLIKNSEAKIKANKNKVDEADEAKVDEAKLDEVIPDENKD